MRRKSCFNITAAGLAVLLAGAGAVQVNGQERQSIAASSFRLVGTGAPHQGTYRFVTSQAAFNMKTVVGAPYSADAVTSTTQVLPDGNRIFREQSSFIARDSEGRTRQEMPLPIVGAWVPENQEQRQVMIHDPVNLVTYTLDPTERVARKASMPTVIVGGDGDKEWVFGVHTDGDGETASSTWRRAKDGSETTSSSGVFVVQRTPEGVKVVGPEGEITATEVRMRNAGEMKKLADLASRSGDKEASVHFYSTASGAGPNVLHFNNSIEEGETRTEELGTRTMEGVLVEGTRTVRTIAAGKLGNELPIEIVNDRWYSQELQTEVMTRFYDPRFGETLFQLKNLSRVEPAPDLFEVPPDYTIKNESGFGFRQKKN